MIKVKSITTKHGTALINEGYWVISNGSKKNHKKRLHRLLYEDYHNCTLLPNAVIHHRDGNRLNNRKNNLELMDRATHVKLHHTGKKRSEETLINISNNRKGIPCRQEQKIKTSKSLNSTGFFRVTMNDCSSCKQGFIWVYQYYVNGKQKPLKSTDLNKLKQKVSDNNLDWDIIDEDSALLTCEKYSYDILGLV